MVAGDHALSQASRRAGEADVLLIFPLAISPQDYVAHDRSHTKTDFTPRNLIKVRPGR